MKTLPCLLGLCVGCILSFASDLTLTDGRVLKDATILEQSPRYVTVRHTAGLSSIAKTVLPPELRAQYPVDEAAAREADLKAAQDRIKAQQLALERQAREKVRQEAAAARAAEPAVDPAAKAKAKYDAAMAEVKERAKNYFMFDYEPVAQAKNVSDVNVTILELRLVEGWNNRWFVTGKCDVQSYELMVETPYYSPRVIKHYEGSGQVLDYTPRETAVYSYQTYTFEAYYSTETATPTFDVKLR